MRDFIHEPVAFRAFTVDVAIQLTTWTLWCDAANEGGRAASVQELADL